MNRPLDLNVSNYSLAEMMAIVDLDDLNPSDIITNTNYYIRKYKSKNPTLSVFFKDIQSQLLSVANEDEEDEGDEGNEGNEGDDKIRVEGFSNNQQSNEWFENENLTQQDENQTNKITERKQKIQTFASSHVPMKQEQLATTDTYTLPVKQDSLNPNLKNTIVRFVNLDSQFRQYTSGVDSMSTEYTCDLSDTLKNTLKLSLYSYQIPFSWYAIDTAYGNTCFWIYDPSSNNLVTISVPAGNYSQVGFQTTLNQSFSDAGFVFVSPPVQYNSNNGILTLMLNGGQWTSSDASTSFAVSTDTQIIFYDFTRNLQCNINCYNKSNHFFNSTLGWIMGYRLPYMNVDASGNVASAILDLTGTKYLILVIDDYNQNRMNDSLVSISQFNNTMKIPAYPTDLPYICIPPLGTNLPELIAGVKSDAVFNSASFNANNGAYTSTNFNTTISNVNGLLIGGKYQHDYTSTQIALPSAPRTYTNAQLDSINSANNNNNNLTNYLCKAPTSSDILALIPVKTSTGVPTGSLLVEFSGSLQNNTRTYFGPVNIERLNVKLLNDKGNVLNLNGNDWCVSLIAECLYQY